MTFAQWAIIGILLAMLEVYATERFRVELVAMGCLGLLRASCQFRPSFQGARTRRLFP